MYIACMWILTSLVSLGLIFNADTRPFLAPFFMIYYALGSDTMYFISNPLNNILDSVTVSALLQMLLMATIILSSFFFHITVRGKLKAILSQKNHFLFGLLIFSAALLINGAFSENLNHENFLYGALSVVGLTIAYLAIKATLPDTDNTIEYLCHTVLCFGYTVFAQLAILVIKNYTAGTLFKLSSTGSIIGLNEAYIILPWGISNMIGAAIISAVPAAIYLAYTKKNCIFYYLSAFAFVFASFFTMGRTAMLTGMLFLFIGIILCSFFSKNSLTCHVLNACIILSIGIAAIISFANANLISITDLDFYISYKFGDSYDTRLSLLKKGFEDFRSAPIFGIGLINPEGTHANDYSNMYHNIIIQILASLGIFGIAAFSLHIKDLASILFHRPSKEKFILFLTPALIITISLFDNFFFYLNFQMIYAAFLAALEFNHNSTISNKIIITTKE